MLNRFYNSRDIAVLKGKTLVDVQGIEDGSREVLFSCSDGTKYKLYHQQDGDENVYLSSVSGTTLPDGKHTENPAPLLKGPVTVVEWTSFDAEYLPPVCKHKPHEGIMAVTRTLYLIATTKGVAYLKWTASSDDPMESTEMDFVQVEGEGMWKEDKE